MNILAEIAEAAANATSTAPGRRVDRAAWQWRTPLVKERIVPECRYRASVLSETQEPCCGGRIRAEQVFGCKLPANALRAASGGVCQKCVFRTK